jgi:hypothetical protein
VTGTILSDNAVIFGTLVIHTTIATVLYDPHTTHSFISAQFATNYGIFKCPLRSRKIISAPEGKMLVNYICPKVSVKINGIDFPADLIVIVSGTIIRGTLKTPNSQLVTPISTKLQRPDGCD